MTADKLGGWIGFEFPVSLELIRSGDTIITWEFHDAKGKRYFVEAPATGTPGAEMQYHPGTGTKIEEIQENAPQSSPRRFGVRCGTDLYSQNILTGNIPGRYLHAEITVSQAVSACKVYLREIRQGNKLWQGQEQLTFEPSEATDSLSKAVFQSIKYRVDVLLLPSIGGVVVCNHNRTWARGPRLNDIFAARGPYDLTIDIGGENAAGETFSLRFDWTGDWQTSFLRKAKRLS